MWFRGKWVKVPRLQQDGQIILSFHLSLVLTQKFATLRQMCVCVWCGPFYETAHISECLGSYALTSSLKWGLVTSPCGRCMLGHFKCNMVKQFNGVLIKHTFSNEEATHVFPPSSVHTDEIMDGFWGYNVGKTTNHLHQCLNRTPGPLHTRPHLQLRDPHLLSWLLSLQWK